MATKKTTHKWGLKRDIAERWLQALETGEFKQVKGSWETRIVGEHCVLGVLGKVNGARKGHCNFVEQDLLRRNMQSCLVGKERDQAVQDFRSKVMRMNDRGTNFKDLAKFIRENVKLVDDVS